MTDKNDFLARALGIAERGAKHPGMLTSNEVCILSMAYLQQLGKNPLKSAEPPPEPEKKKRPKNK